MASLMRDLHVLLLSLEWEGIQLACKQAKGGVWLGSAGKGVLHPSLVPLPTCASWLPWNFPLTFTEAKMLFAGAVFPSFPMNTHLMGCTANRESFGSMHGEVCELCRSPQTLAGGTQGLMRSVPALYLPTAIFVGLRTLIFSRAHQQPPF